MNNWDTKDRRADVFTPEFAEAFQRAYEAWRISLSESDTGLFPWADLTPDRLLQAVRREIQIGRGEIVKAPIVKVKLERTP